MKLLLWAILGILCFMAGPFGWAFWWLCFALAFCWGTVAALGRLAGVLLLGLWLGLCALLAGAGRLLRLDREGW